MRYCVSRYLAGISVAFLALFAAISQSDAQTFWPSEFGSAVNGYQDDFDGQSLKANWTPTGASTEIYSVSGGQLHVTTADGDPNHLLYTLPGYDDTTQEVLARIRFTNFGTGDQARGGLGVGVDPGSSQGINFHFRDYDSGGVSGRHMAFLDDFRAWGPATDFKWQNNTWYWVRFKQDPNSPNGEVLGKIWLGDGSVAEPANWHTWNYMSQRPVRAGFAGITAGSSGGNSEFDVDYILIKAAGLPTITAAAEAFPLFTPGPVTISTQPANVTVAQCSSAAFSVTVDGTPPYSFQWHRNATAIPNATNETFILNNAQVSDDGAKFHVVVRNSFGGTVHTSLSTEATLTVTRDTTRPVLLAAENSGLDQIIVQFSKAVTLATATNISNYRISGSLPVLRANVAAGGTNVVLTTQGQVEGVLYTLSVSNLADDCAGNVIAANSEISFRSRLYAIADIGGPATPGTNAGKPGGYDVTGAGTGFGGPSGISDQFHFSHVQRTGDFDVKVRIENLIASQSWAEAGLIARETLGADSRFAGAFATPSMAGSFFKSRTAASGAISQVGSHQVNYPQTWLRLKRSGNVFTGYASFDGQAWTQLGSANIALPATVYFGFAVASHDPSQAATAAFRDLQEVSGATVAGESFVREPLGQSSRKTGLAFSEIMYHPARSFAGVRTLEFVELFNTLDTPVDLSGYELDGDIHFTFPAGTVIAGGAFLVVASMPGDVEITYGIPGVAGPWRDNLPNDSGLLQLKSHAGAVLLEVNYETTRPWPISPDGAGHSLVLARPSLGEASAAAWGASDAIGGSPGRMDPISANPVRAVMLNEILAHTDLPETDFIELYNHSSNEVDISGSFLSDDPETNKFRIPASTKIPARGFVSFTQEQLGFSLEADGETIFFRSADGRVVDALRFEGQANGVALGRFPDGAKDLRALSAKTPSEPNAPFATPPVVINEIMHSPISRDDNDEYVELYNRSATAIDLSGWKLTSGIDFTFPSNLVLQPNGYVVVAANASRLRTNYANLSAANLVGDFSGKLSNDGERLTLTRPDTQIAPNSAGQLTTNIIHIVVNEVTYGVGGKWGEWSAKGGSSLELIDPKSDNSLTPNWADSDESSKAPWTTVSVTGILDNGNVPADSLQVLLQDAGECLIDDVQVLNASSVNVVANSTFESGATGWTAEGTEAASGPETSQGFNSSRSYHVRAVSRGDNQLNRIRTPLTAALAANSTATIRAKVKWLRGSPDLLLRLRGNWLEAICRMDLPRNLGSPGSPNSRMVPNTGPAIHDVIHQPILPQAGEAVRVTARVHDPDNLAAVQVRYRIDPSNTTVSIPMRDDGTAGDELAGDGLFSAMIPGQASGALVAFHVRATDRNSAPLSSTFPQTAPLNECLIRFGETQPSGSFPVYRMWMTQATLNTWSTRQVLNNTPLPVTFVLGNQRVIYGAKALYAGSPYIAPGYSGPTSGRCGYSISFPDDDLFLGSNDLVLDWPGGHGNETTAIQEQMAYHIAERIGLPYSHRYFIRLHVNGVTEEQRRTIYEAVNQPDSEFIKAWSPGDDDGDFYKIDRAFEFSNSGGLVADPMPTLQKFTTTGGAKKLARYRWNWLKRATDEPNNYTNIFNLVDTLNLAAPEPYTSATHDLVDIEEWMGIFAVEHIINNFDSWGHDIGKNMYAYKPENGPWQLYMFDLDWLMLVANGWYTASNGPLFNSADPVVARMYAHPPFRRAYFRAVLDAVNGPLLAANANAVMDAKYNSLVANGVRYCDGQSLTAPTAVKTWFVQRRNYLLTQLATVAANFSVAGPSTVQTATSPVSMSGTAPIAVQTIQVNGVEVPVTWTTVSNWTIRVPLLQRTNRLSIVGIDNQGSAVAGASNGVTVHFSGAVVPSATVVINEWMASNSKTIADSASGIPRFDDWFELYNYGTNVVNLSGYFLTDRLNEKTLFEIPSGYSIPPGGYLLVWADGEPEQNRTGDSALHAGFQLSAGGEAIGLFAPDGTEIDSVTFGAQTADVSESLCPNGTGSPKATAVATPGTANQCASTSAPEFGLSSLNGNQFSLVWNAEVGRTCQIEYTESLTAPQWIALGEPFQSDGTPSALTIDTSAARNRFFRIKILE